MQVSRTRETAARGSTPGRAGVPAAALVVLALAAVIAGGGDLASTPGTGMAGYAAIFVAGFIASVTVLLPVPMMATAMFASAFLNPFAVGFMAATGIATGLWPSYAAGGLGAGALESANASRHAALRSAAGLATRQLRRRPFLASFVLAAVPNPVFDWSGMIAGAAGVPFRRYLLGAYTGKLLQLTVAAVTGYLIAGGATGAG